MPRCPRCAARLFIELSHLRTHANERVRRTEHRDGDEEREDAYAREDVYVAAESSRD